MGQFSGSANQPKTRIEMIEAPDRVVAPSYRPWAPRNLGAVGSHSIVSWFSVWTPNANWMLGVPTVSPPPPGKNQNTNAGTFLVL